MVPVRRETNEVRSAIALVSCPEQFPGLGAKRGNRVQGLPELWREIPVQGSQCGPKLQGRTPKWVELHKENLRSAERAS